MRIDDGDMLPRSARLSFRRPDPADEEATLRLRLDPTVMRFLGGPLTRPAAVERFRRDLAHWAVHGYGRYVVASRADGAFVGIGGLQEFESEPDLGYLLAPQWWGRGLATELASACLGFAFESLGFSLVRALTQVDNHASRRVLTKVGMRYLGDRVLWGEKQRLYAITAGEWAARRATGSREDVRSSRRP